MCKPGIKQKFQENYKPRDMLLNYTRDKLIIECAKDTLWGNGVPLEHDQCLDRSVWRGTGPKKQGIMGKILGEIRTELMRAPAGHPPHQGHACPPPINPEVQLTSRQTTTTCMDYSYNPNPWSISSNNTSTTPPGTYAAESTSSVLHTGT